MKTVVNDKQNSSIKCCDKSSTLNCLIYIYRISLLSASISSIFDKPMVACWCWRFNPFEQKITTLKSCRLNVHIAFYSLEFYLNMYALGIRRVRLYERCYDSDTYRERGQQTFEFWNVIDYYLFGIKHWKWSEINLKRFEISDDQQILLS